MTQEGPYSEKGVKAVISYLKGEITGAKLSNVVSDGDPSSGATKVSPVLRWGLNNHLVKIEMTLKRDRPAYRKVVR